jgi:hypothetical protein
VYLRTLFFQLTICHHFSWTLCSAMGKQLLPNRLGIPSMPPIYWTPINSPAPKALLSTEIHNRRWACRSRDQGLLFTVVTSRRGRIEIRLLMESFHPPVPYRGKIRGWPLRLQETFLPFKRTRGSQPEANPITVKTATHELLHSHHRTRIALFSSHPQARLFSRKATTIFPL